MSVPLLVAYKVLTQEQRDALVAAQIFHGAPVDLADGYIHLSTAEQLAETLDKHFAGQSDLFVAAVDLDKLGNSVRWEASRGGQLFPHIYGPLPLAFVCGLAPVIRRDDGSVILPDEPHAPE